MKAVPDDQIEWRIAVGGDSAGGNLAAALMLRARDEGLPMPAAAVALSLLTGLYDRRSFDRLLEMAVARSVRYGWQFTLDANAPKEAQTA